MGEPIAHDRDDSERAHHEALDSRFSRVRPKRRFASSCAALSPRSWLYALATTFVATAALIMLLLPADAAPVYSYFPTGQTNDGKMLCVAGDGLNTLSGTSVTVSFSVDDSESDFLLGFFDGASNSTWDMITAAFPTAYTLYADPLGNGTGTTVVASWTDADMTNNSWRDFPVNTTPAAQSPSGNYFYHLTVTATTPTASALNAFKVRVEGYTYIIPTTVFGYIGAYPSDPALIYPNWPAYTNSTHDGIWNFYMNVAEEATYINLYDGDFDLTNDTNDPNSSGVPWFDSGRGVAEAARPGSPADDTATSPQYLRTPNIRYTINAPDGASYPNLNPSGNTEWELFRLDTTTNNPAITDHQAARLPAGMYTVSVTGVDMHNLNALRFEHPIVGVDINGRPTPPPAPFLIGDKVFLDSDVDGVQDPGEQGLPNVVVTLCDKNTGAVLAAATTDATGAYTINSWNGTFNVVVADSNFKPGGALEEYAPTLPNPATRSVTVANNNQLTADFGFQIKPLPESIIVSPDRTGTMAPGQTIEYVFTVHNNAVTAGTFNLSTTSSMSWPRQVLSTSGTPISALTLGAGESRQVLVRVSVPPSATIGQQDVTRLTATHSVLPDVTDNALGTTRVLEGLRLTPDNEAYGPAGSQVFHTHTVSNSWPTTRTVSVSAVAGSWTTGLYAMDGTTPITALTVGPNGSTATFKARVDIPGGAANGASDTANITATSGSASASATDRTIARGLMTYSDATYASPKSVFPRGDTAFARATGLTPGANVRFVWVNSGGTTMRTSALTAVNAQGMAFDPYPTTVDDALGGWTVRLLDAGGAVLETTPFTVVFNAEITRVTATNAPAADTNISISSMLANRATAPILNSSVTYVVWWDSNGDGIFGAGDIYIDGTGTPRLWNGVSAVTSYVSSGRDVAGTSTFTDPPWTLSNSLFPYNGMYKVTATWKTAPGTVIDAETGEFYSSRTSDPGNVVVDPDQAAAMAPGQTASYSFTVINKTVAPGTFDLSTTSSRGWTNQIVSLSGAPISSVVLGSWETTTVIVRVNVPSGAAFGDQDTMVLRAQLTGTPAVSDTARAVTTAQRGIDITPDNAGVTAPGFTIDYTHTVANSYPTTRTISLTAVPGTAGWTARIYAMDGVTQITQVTVGPNGATQDIIVRVTVPATAPRGTVDVTTVTATSGAESDIAVDRTTVRRLMTYTTNTYAVPADVFVIGNVVYARATGLVASSNHYFRWYDANGTLVRTSGSTSSGGSGIRTDSYTTTAASPTGSWRVEIWRDLATDQLVETTPFTVGFSAGITALSATDAASVGDLVRVTSSTTNQIATAITNSTMTYVIWWDTNGNGVFDATDIYIDSSGTPVIWNGVAAVTPTRVTSGINVAGNGTWTEAVPWSVSNTDFPNQGTYKVTATWRNSSGTLLDVKTSEFYSIPALGWPLFGLTLIGITVLMWRKLRPELQIMRSVTRSGEIA